MHLTRQEERIYDGEFGWTNQVCMKILVSLGELFNATKLIPISHSHVSGVSYKTLGDAPTEFLEALANAKAKVKVKSTLNPQSLDCKILCKRLPSNLREKQLNILNYFEKMGFTQSLTCTPYYLEEPKKGSHLSWAESSAVIYANSILGAWTNREGGPSALAAAIIGKTPNYGMHQAENRQAKVFVRLEKPLVNDVEFGALGIFLGEILKDKIPIIQDLEKTSKDNLKHLGAALASAGMTNMFYYKTLNLKTSEFEKINVHSKDLKRTIEKLTTTSTQTPDLIFLGCPHCSLNEIRQITELIGNRKIKNGVELWVCTSHNIKEKAKKHVKRIEKSGGYVITDTCAVVTWTEKLGIKTIMTNSAKTAHYAPTLNKAEVTFAPLKECIKTAIKG